mmetsp:Transcript_96049/g.298587  ORF Transcript_96049/g.298587 Transcript_96049/m.298587 type:complete len:147 (+) Transcript_96049:2-442(+)
MRLVDGPVQKLLPDNAKCFALSPQGRAVGLRDMVREASAAHRKEMRDRIFSSMDVDRDGQISREEFESFVRKSPTASAMHPEITVFAVGASEGDAVQEREFGLAYAKERVSINPWSLRASCCCQMLVHEYEHLWHASGSRPGSPHA